MESVTTKRHHTASARTYEAKQNEKEIRRDNIFNAFVVGTSIVCAGERGKPKDMTMIDLKYLLVRQVLLFSFSCYFWSVPKFQWIRREKPNK